MEDSDMRIRRFKTAAASTVLTFGLAIAAPAMASDFFNGFETDTSGWTVFGGAFNPTRVPSGTNGITSATGSFHAEGTTSAGNWGGYNNVDGCGTSACAAGATFPPNGYDTSLAIYLDVNGGFANDTRFDFTSAVSQPDGNHRRDFAFNCGFYNDNDGPGAGVNRFICSASNNTGRANAFPKNPGREPTAIATTTGWYTFRHEFRDNGAGILTVDLSVLEPGGTLIKTWTLSDSSDTIDGTVAGNRYGWFAQNEFPFLAFDDTERHSIVVDSDGDGIPDDADDCPSSDLTATVVVDSCDSGVDNVLDSSGCTIADQVQDCADNAGNHGGFVSCVSHLLNDLKKEEVISGRDKGAIESCAGRSSLP
jgi:hypothetical protein